MPRDLPAITDPVPAPPSLAAAEAAGTDASGDEHARVRHGQIARIRTVARQIAISRGLAVSDAERWIADTRRYLRSLLDYAPYVEGAYPCKVLSIQDRTLRHCTVQLLESGGVISRVQYDPTVPTIGAEYAARHTRRLNPLQERGLPEDVHWTLKVPGSRWLYWLWQATFGGPLTVYRVAWPPSADDQVEVVRTGIAVPLGTTLNDCRLVATSADRALVISVQRWTRNFTEVPVTLIRLGDWGTGDLSTWTVGTALPAGPVRHPFATAYFSRYSNAEVETPFLALFAGDASPGAQTPTLVGAYTYFRWTELVTTALDSHGGPVWLYVPDRPHDQEVYSVDGGHTWQRARSALRHPVVKITVPGGDGTQFTKANESPLRHYLRSGAVWTDAAGTQRRVYEWHHATPEPTNGQLEGVHRDPIADWEQFVDLENFTTELTGATESPILDAAPAWVPVATSLGGEPSLNVMGPRDDVVYWHARRGDRGARPPGSGVNAYYALVNLHHVRTARPTGGDVPVTLDDPPGGTILPPRAGSWDAADLLAATPVGALYTSQDGGETWAPLATPRPPEGQSAFAWTPEDTLPHAAAGVTAILEGV